MAGVHMTEAEVVKDIAAVLARVRQGVEVVVEKDLCTLTLAEIGHGIYRANTPELRQRRRVFLDDLKAAIPIHTLTAVSPTCALCRSD
jgi:hypothetical protein